MIRTAATMQTVDPRSVALHTLASVGLVVAPMPILAGVDGAAGWALGPPLWLLQAIGLLGMSNAAHECVHGHLLRRRTFDRWAGRLFHLPMLVNFDAHRRYHLDHHAHTAGEEDPEGTFDYRDIPSVGRYLALVARWLLPPSPLLLLNHAIAVRGLRTETGARRARLLTGELLVVAFLALVIAATVADPAAVVRAYWIPALVVFPALAFLTSLPEHFGLAESASATGHTRTVLAPAWQSWLLWNINYHTAHHARPNTPFHALDRLHHEMGAEIVHVSRGYLRFHRDLLRAVRAQGSRPERRTA